MTDKKKELTEDELKQAAGGRSQTQQASGDAGMLTGGKTGSPSTAGGLETEIDGDTERTGRRSRDGRDGGRVRPL